MASQVLMTYLQAPLDSLEEQVNAAIARLEESGGEILSVQIMGSTGRATSTGAVIVVRTSAAAGIHASAHDAVVVPDAAAQQRADDTHRDVRDYALGCRMQEERALRRRVQQPRSAS